MRYRTSANVTANAVSGAKTIENTGAAIIEVDYNFENIAFDAAKNKSEVSKNKPEVSLKKFTLPEEGRFEGP